MSQNNNNCYFNVTNVFSGKISWSSNSSDNLVIDLSKESEKSTPSKSSDEISFNSETERILNQVTLLANPRIDGQHVCPISEFARQPRKVPFIPLNKTSENLIEEVIEDENGELTWHELPEAQTLCGHCGLVLLDAQRQVINWPCWHRSHVECQREYKCLNWDQFILYCGYKACGLPIIDDGDHLFNVEQFFWREFCPWRYMATFMDLLNMSDNQKRHMEAIGHNYRIVHGVKWDPTYLCHYRQAVQGEIHDIIEMEEYNRDLPLSLNGVKMRVNARSKRNGTEFIFVASHETEKHPMNAMEYDFQEIKDIGYFRDFDEDENVENYVYWKIGKALVNGEQEVDFRDRFNIKIEFKSQRGILKQFRRGRFRGDFIPEDLDHFDEDDDDNEGRHDGRGKMRPPSQNNFHIDPIARLNAAEEEQVEEREPDEVQFDPNDPNEAPDDSDEGSGDLDEGMPIEQVLQKIQEELEESIDRLEDEFVQKEILDEVVEVLKMKKEKGTQTKSKGYKNVGVQATDLPFDFRDNIVNYLDYHLQNYLLHVERGYYEPKTVLFVLKLLNAIPKLKEKVCGFAKEPKILIPRLKGQKEFDLDLAVVSGFNVVHNGSFQYSSWDQPMVNSKVIEPERLYYDFDSFDEEDEEFKTAVAGDESSNVTIASSLDPVSNLTYVLHTTQKRVRLCQISVLICWGKSVSSIFFRERGPFIKTLSSQKAWSAEGSGSTVRQWRPHRYPRPQGPCHFRRHARIQNFGLMEKKICQSTWTNSLKRHKAKKMRRPTVHQRPKGVPNGLGITVSKNSCVCLNFVKSKDSNLVRYFLVNFCDNLGCKGAIPYKFSSIILLRLTHGERLLIISKCYVTFFYKQKRVQRVFSLDRTQSQYVQTRFYNERNKDLTKYILVCICHFFRKVLLYSSTLKMIAQFSIPAAFGDNFCIANLHSIDINFPKVQYESLEGQRGTFCELEMLEFGFSFQNCNFSVILVNKQKFDSLVMPLLVLLHSTGSYVEILLMTSYSRVGIEEPRLPKWLHETKIGDGQYKKVLTCNGKLSVDIKKALTMGESIELFKKMASFCTDVLALIRFEEQMEDVQLEILCNYLRITDEIRSTYKMITQHLPLSNHGSRFVGFVFDRLAYMDKAFFVIMEQNMAQMEQYFKFELLESWKLGSITSTQLLMLANKEIPDRHRCLFSRLASQTIEW